ncbi:hypothetical protein BU17DRAFT_74097 [Hysterangium stoloniferum]|nr:hypothetical protein BU17DRAFT_74097 [Hysterangium stoloniferum]
MAAVKAAAATTTFEPAMTSSNAMHFSYSGRPSDKYRGAVVEDLQLPPAFALPENEAIARAIELAYDRDFSHIPVLSAKGRRPLGYIDVAILKSKWEAGEVDPNDPVSVAMARFRRRASNDYTLITPSTPLEDLEKFLQNHIFALVTDYDRQFVLALATRADLENFVSRRGL